MELEQLGFMVHGYHQVEIEMIEPGKTALLVTQIRDVLIKQPCLAATEPILAQLRSLKDDAGGALHLEQVIGKNKDGVRVNGLLSQLDQDFCGCSYCAQ